jgi:hypothetical protein
VLHSWFDQLVRKGTLPGKTRSNRVDLINLQPAHLKLIQSESAGRLFDRESPTVLRRLKP